MKAYSVARKPRTVDETRANNKFIYFGVEITETNIPTPKNALGWTLGADVGFRDDNNFYVIFNDTYRMIRLG